MTELPLVVVDVQRGGPSTGLPTKTEQADLLQAMFGRNGEAPLPIVAPRSPGDCFDAITAHRTYHTRPRSPFEALQYMLGPSRVSFDPAALWAMVDRPQLAGLGVERGALGIFQSMRKGVCRHRGPRQPRVVLRYRSILVDAQHPSGEIAPDIGIVREVAILDAVEIGVVKAETIRAGDEQRAVACDDNTALRALGEILDVLEPQVVRAEARARTHHQRVVAGG